MQEDVGGLGKSMAMDARKVIAGTLSEKTFLARYRRKVRKAFGVDLMPRKLGPGVARAAEKEDREGKGQKKSPRWIMVIDLAKCIGCDTCTVSCKAENRTPPGVSYNVVIEKEIGEYPNTRRQNIPRPCMQCMRPPCAQVCPVGATYKREDGITAIDYDRCIGCRYCMVACPYGARSFDFGQSYDQEMVGFNELQAPEYGVDRGPREQRETPIGNVRKCTFCLHRLGRGEEPACVETCIGDARFFGDINDPDSEVSKMVASPRAFRLKEELGTEPSVYYLL